MTYHVLARKWRPQTFSDLVGQTHVKKALTFALSQNQVHHAYLFTGTRGVGKTSIARIFAKSLNCEVNGVSANPCGECESCQEIKAGKFVDLIEVDAASRTGVEETRELIESVSYLPTKGRFKVYLIDEVHMFSKSSFNALLKTLEEPPEHVKFILATTDPEKLPVTILSRCLQFNLKSLTTVQICQHLANICQAESIHYEKEALSLLAKAGDGSMRDTLSMTDQAIAYGQGELTIAAVTEILGTIQPADIEVILFAIATNNPNQLSVALYRLDNYEVDARAFLIEIMKRLQRMAWAKEGIVEQLSPALLSTVSDIPKPLLHLWYDIAEKALPNLSLSGDPREAVEMALLRMLAFIPDDWVVRHRTLLTSGEVSDDTINEVEDTVQTPQSQKKTIEQPTEKITTSQKTTEIGHKVQAEPIPESQDLLEAEARFNGESVGSEKISEEKTSEETEEKLPEQKLGNQQSKQIEEISTAESQWHLSEEVNNEPAPSMQELQSIMQTARNIKPPEAKPPRPQAAEQSSSNKSIPPWELKDEVNDNITQSTDVVEGEVEDGVNSPESLSTKQNDGTESHSWRKKVSEFDWFEDVEKLSLSDYTKHFVSLGLLDLTPQQDSISALFSLSPKHEVMMTEETLCELKQVLTDYFGIVVNLETQLIDLHTQTPSDLIAQREAQSQADLLKQFESLSAVKAVTQALDAKIIEKTIKRT